MKRTKKPTKVMAEINITPFTDVVLVLLIIFMIATPMLLQPGIKVELPKARAAQTNTDKNISITVGSDNTIYLDDQRIELNKLRQEISLRLANKPDLAVMVKGDKEVHYDTIVKVVDAAKLAGAKKFALGVELKNGPFGFYNPGSDKKE